MKQRQEHSQEGVRDLNNHYHSSQHNVLSKGRAGLPVNMQLNMRQQ